MHTQIMNTLQNYRNNCVEFFRVVWIYLSHQEQEAWGGQATGRGTEAPPSPETGQGSD